MRGLKKEEKGIVTQEEWERKISPRLKKGLNQKAIEIFNSAPSSC